MCEEISLLFCRNENPNQQSKLICGPIWIFVRSAIPLEEIELCGGYIFLKSRKKRKKTKENKRKEKKRKWKGKKSKEKEKKESTIKYTNWKNRNMLNQYFRLAWRSVPFSGVLPIPTPSPLGSRGSHTWSRGAAGFAVFCQKKEQKVRF